MIIKKKNLIFVHIRCWLILDVLDWTIEINEEKCISILLDFALRMDKYASFKPQAV